MKPLKFNTQKWRSITPEQFAVMRNRLIEKITEESDKDDQFRNVMLSILDRVKTEIPRMPAKTDMQQVYCDFWNLGKDFIICLVLSYHIDAKVYEHYLYP